MLHFKAPVQGRALQRQQSVDLEDDRRNNPKDAKGGADDDP